MSRFYWTSIIFLFLAGISFIFFSSPQQELILLLLLVIYLALFSMGVAVLRLKFFCRAVCRGKTGINKIFLTFDDGPDLQVTPVVLSVLESYHIKAAFFCIGEKVAQYPQMARRIVDEGHTIANHSMHHFWWTNFLTFKGLNREMAETQAVIKSITGETPAFFRPPAGLTNPHIEKALRKNDLTCIGWDVRPFDTKRPKDRVVNTIARKAREGSIVLMHDTGRTPQDMEALVRDVIAALQSKGFSFSTLNDLVGLEPYQRNDAVEKESLSTGIIARITLWLAQASFIRKALADDISPADIKQRPSTRFFVGLSLVAFSYIIGWPAVAFFAFLGVYLDVKEIVLLGPASYLFSYLVFIAGAALAGVDGIKYGRLFYRWTMHQFALRIAARIKNR
ncbi:MAG: polysaccharide deacetylase family protein [Deltaproteobacteria bacterium]|nr:polysaccharide deacetylase family protein [Deltaproteobacteria bacterium]